jgi:hypothetical protein
MAFAGGSTPGKCIVDGKTHDHSGTFNYVLKHDLRRCVVEIDKMKGTRFPPDSATFEGKTISLETIFGNTGITLEIEKDEGEIESTGAIAAPSTITQAELHNLISSHRKPFKIIGDKMFGYLIIVSPKFVDEKGKVTDKLGETINVKVGTGPFRQASVVFFNSGLGTGTDRHKPAASEDDLSFLHTASHELGHQFNLHHQDFEHFFDGTRTRFTIMLSSSDPNALLRLRWPNSESFSFGNHEQIHLSTHPLKNVAPGGSEQYHCNAEHAGWHAGMTID